MPKDIRIKRKILVYMIIFSYSNCRMTVRSHVGTDFYTQVVDDDQIH